MSACCVQGPCVLMSGFCRDQAAMSPSPLSWGPALLLIVPWLPFPTLPRGFWTNSWAPRPCLAGLGGGPSSSPCSLPSEPASVHYRTQYTQRKQQKSRHPRPSSQYNQKLFGGDMEKFIQVLALPRAPTECRPSPAFWFLSSPGPSLWPGCL